MALPQMTPYGTWKSSISPLQKFVWLSYFALDGADIFWHELRPAELGRGVVVRHTPDGTSRNLTRPGFNVRTLVHEYGGGTYLVADGSLYFTNFEDQRIYRQATDGSEYPQPITPANGWRYADLVFDRARHRLIAVCEDHGVAADEPENRLVSIPLDGTGLALPLVRGNNFYAAPRLSPDGTQLAWLTWNHPNMPWDGTELWVGRLDADGNVTAPTRIAGGADESIFQPAWSPAGVLHFVSDRTGWWNLYRHRAGQSEPLHPMAAEFGAPQWNFGLALYDFLDADHLVCAYTQQGLWHLGRLDATNGDLTEIPTPFTYIERVQVHNGQVWLMGGSPTEFASIARLDVASGALTTLRRANEQPIAADTIAVATPIEFATTHNRTAYGFFYAPLNPLYQTPPTEKPPLLVMCHGGPVFAVNSMLDFAIQYWTSRGIAVLNVNYSGSTGYGRAYRERLAGQWGIVDVEDCLAGAKHLVDLGLVDGQRLMINGGSAGGFTTLCALTFHDLFQAGSSHFGVSDLATLREDLHKFEWDTLEKLIGPYATMADRYVARSPLHFADQLACPVIFFQGLEDPIVPPSQSEMMVNALRTKGLPVAYIAFADEQHGFRKGSSIKRMMEVEFAFYARIFGYTPADVTEPVVIDNL